MGKIFDISLRSKKILFVPIAVIVASVSLFAVSLFRSEVSTTWYGYVVGEDRRIYSVNLETGGLEWVSQELQQIGAPTEIEINTEESILYIASGPEYSSGVWNYVPLLAVKINEEADIVYESWIDPNNPDGSNNANGLSRGPAVYSVRLSQNQQALYAGFSHESFQRRTILNPATARIIGQSDAFISKEYEFSPDGTMLAEIYPGITRLDENGAEEYLSIILARDVETGEIVLRTEHPNNENLYPPWGSTDDHFIHVRNEPRQNIYRLEVYDRDSGELLGMYDEFPESVKAMYSQRHVTRIPGSDNVAMTAGNEVLVFNGLTAELVKRIHVADVRLTEVVVSDKPPSRVTH